MEVKEAFKVIKQAMKDDSPNERGSYAHGWHCNIAMAVYDSMDDVYNHEEKHKIGNDAASRFMKLCFDVETRP